MHGLTTKGRGILASWFLQNMAKSSWMDLKVKNSSPSFIIKQKLAIKMLILSSGLKSAMLLAMVFLLHNKNLERRHHFTSSNNQKLNVRM